MDYVVFFALPFANLPEGLGYKEFFHCHAIKAKSNEWTLLDLVKKLGYYYPDFYDFLFPFFSLILNFGLDLEHYQTLETTFYQEPIARSL